jgi:hypothetical protein
LLAPASVQDGKDDIGAPLKAYSQDLRRRVLAAADEGERVGQIAAMLRVSVS